LIDFDYESSSTDQLKLWDLLYQHRRPLRGRVATPVAERLADLERLWILALGCGVELAAPTLPSRW
jgi:hypothetical protein